MSKRDQQFPNRAVGGRQRQQADQRTDPKRRKDPQGAAFQKAGGSRSARAERNDKTGYDKEDLDAHPAKSGRKIQGRKSEWLADLETGFGERAEMIEDHDGRGEQPQ